MLILSLKNYQKNFQLACFAVIISLLILKDMILSNSKKKDVMNYKDRLEEYKKLHYKNIKDWTTKRIVFNNPSPNGYANRIYSVLSSLLIGILSDRALLINWKHIDNYIESPLYRVFDTFNDTNELNFNYNSSTIEGIGFGEAWKRNKTIKINNYDVLKFNKTRVKFEQITAYFFELCSYPQYYDRLLYYGLVSNKTIEIARKAIGNKTHLSKSKEQDLVFQVGFEVGGNLLRNFWKPKRFIQDQIDEYYEKYFKGNFVIGLQLRVQFLKESLDIQKFIDCAYKIESYYNNSLQVKWFVSSDSEKLVSKLKELFAHKVISTNGTIKNIARNVLTGYNRTILDSELLSLCNRIIITGGSTFGFVPSLKSFHLPYYINGHSSMNSCRKVRLSHLPISHYGTAIFKK